MSERKVSCGEGEGMAENKGLFTLARGGFEAEASCTRQEKLEVFA